MSALILGPMAACASALVGCFARCATRAWMREGNEEVTDAASSRTHSMGFAACRSAGGAATAVSARLSYTLLFLLAQVRAERQRSRASLLSRPSPRSGLLLADARLLQAADGEDPVGGEGVLEGARGERGDSGGVLRHPSGAAPLLGQHALLRPPLAGPDELQDHRRPAPQVRPGAAPRPAEADSPRPPGTCTRAAGPSRSSCGRCWPSCPS